MANDYNPKRHGMKGKANPETDALREDWAKADELNAKLPEGTEWAWAPRDSIYIDEAILPRIGGVDSKLVREYAEMLDDLPPIIVQKDTYRLIDGAHRTNAAYDPNSQTTLLRVIARDVKMKDLEEEAYRANVHHGKPLTSREKSNFARILFAKYPNKPVSDIARLAGISRPTASKIRDEDSGSEDRKMEVERDGKTYERSARSQRATGPVSTPSSNGKGVTRTPVNEGEPPEQAEPAIVQALRAIASERLSAGAWLDANLAYAEAIGENVSAAYDFLAELSDAVESKRLAAEPAAV